MPAAIASDGVVRHQVARLQPHLLEEERVGAMRVARPTRRAVGDRDLLFGPAVHPIAELHRHHAQVITGAHGHYDLIGVRDLRVASGLLDAHHRRAVGDGIDDVLHRARHRGAVDGGEIHVVEAALRHAELARDRAVGFALHRHDGAVVEAQRATLHGARDPGADLHRGADDRGDITAVLDRLRGHPAVRREAQFERHPRHRRQIIDGQRIDRRAHVGGLDVVLGLRHDIEEA